ERTYLLLEPDEEAAGYLFQDLCALLGGGDAGGCADVSLLPSAFRRAAKYGQRDTAAEILRTETLERLAAPRTAGGRPAFIVTHAAALAERVPTGESLASRTLALKRGDTIDLTDLAARLADLGFRRTDYVYEPGDFAVRGSLLDVYSFSEELPLRIDFFGDEVDTIRTFHIDTQLSHEQRAEAVLVAAPDTQAAGVLATDLLPTETTLVVRDLALCLATMGKVYDDGFSRQALVAGETDETLSRDTLLCPRSILEPALLALQRVEVAAATGQDGAAPADGKSATVTFHTSPQPVYHKNYELLQSSLADFRERGYAVLLLADSAKQHERLKAILAGQRPDDAPPSADAPTLFTPLSPTLHAGFSDADTRLCLFTDHQIFDRYHKYTLRSDVAKQGKMALTLKELKTFQYGDYVVHIDHGVGQFGGLVRMPGQDGAMNEAIKILFHGGDVVYVSIHALHKVSKYRGQDGAPPTLSRLGTGAWERLKEKTKKKLKDIARDLIRLYSERRDSRGFAFSADSYLQHELEASFTYEDTPDQLRVTQEVKHDMESRRPMDRLVCGDVGFGKTEIAVRAAFKAACDGKQTAVLVPTTVLALQHYRTFAQRLADMPVRVDYLTRARTAKQTRELLADLAEGKIDILIGTHRLIGKGVKFKDLGLLVIDEEQKFGVAVKEKLRQLKVSVDTLTMSATPIPRTLQFSLMGARDFSTLQTPPPNRRPIQTELHTFGHEVIAEAVNFELSRGGQAFIVTNRIGALDNLQRLVERHVPGVRVATGHGRMKPEELERTVIDFIEGEYDVLISTTIVENGIDIPNANTIIIDAAHTFGLSDLHQMRGRVGRSNRKAFCYLLAPPKELLPDDARRRLEAIETFSDLGSGISIAMQDLEIRGAGNMLGAEQSGFMAELGYETYQKILSQAVAELRNEEGAALPAPSDANTPSSAAATAPTAAEAPVFAAASFIDETTVESDRPAFYPETYVPGAGERMLLYRELGALESDAAQELYARRLRDRFGALPPEAEELLAIASLRRAGRAIAAERILLKGGRMVVYFVGNAASPFYRSAVFDRIIDYAMAHPADVRLDERAGHRRMTLARIPSAAVALQIVTQFSKMK
ncbi:MAG: transcription-repair coupling factor, partial [Bacteroidaceae bacterium]|nr:transcription-repair coupling factor [Bacteroidaceae bacterium]